MLTSKQRAQLRALGNGIPVILQVGKGGINDNLVTQVDDALEARELIKLRTLNTCPLTPSEAARELAAETGAQVVHTLGNTILLYRQSEENPQIYI